MKKSILIFSGYNQRAVVAFLRTLEDKKIKYGIIASSKKDTIFETIYSKKVFSIRSKKQLILEDFIDNIETCKDKLSTDSYVIAPSTEALNRFLLENREEFEAIKCEIPIVRDGLYELISDKYKFGEICKKNNILTPKECQNIDGIPFPYVAKPKKYFNDNGSVYTPFLISNEKEKRQFLKECEFNDFYFQEFIFGKCLYLLYYFYKDGTIAKLSQNNKVQQPGGKSMIAAETSDFHKNMESAKYEKLFVNLGYFGLVMVELKECEGRCYMIEANPRFWGPSQLFVDAGINLFDAFLFDNQLLKKKPQYPSEIRNKKYFWYGGLIEAQKSGKDLAYHDYSKERFEKEYNSWFRVDVYNRADTRSLFEQEIKQ